MVLQLKKNEQKCTDDLDNKMEETEDSECEESNIDDISHNIASNMTIADSETLAKSEGRPKESRAKSDVQSSSLPEVVILDHLMALLLF